VLIADDSAGVVAMMKESLGDGGFDVVTAIDGRDALEKVQTERPDLVMLDLVLPGLSGYEVCTIMKHDQRYQNIPVVIFTGRDEECDPMIAIETGAQLLLHKPLDMETIKSRIVTLLDESSQMGGYN